MAFIKSLIEKIWGRGTSSHIERPPRYNLVPLENVEFEVTEPQGLGIQYLTNVSLEGLGFIKTPETNWPTEKSIVYGVLKIKGFESKLSLEIAHISHETVGCRIIAAPSDYKPNLVTYFASESEATKMRKVRSDMLTPSPLGETHFFVGDNSELHFITKNENIIKFHISFFGNYIEGTEKGFLTAGLVEYDEERSLAYKGSNLVRPTRELSDELRLSTTKLIMNISNLEESYRFQLLKLLSKEQG